MIFKDGDSPVSDILVAKDVILERIRNVATKSISFTEIGVNLGVEELARIGDSMGVQLVHEVLAEPLEVTDYKVRTYIPKTWWDHFKQTYFKGWLLKKFPIKEICKVKIVTFKKYATYPQLPKIYPNAGPVTFRYMVTEKNG